MAESKIEWTDRSDWNPIRGCTRVSPGCGGPGPHGGCYAEAMAARFSDPARSLRDQCEAAGVAFHFKQHGEWSPEKPALFVRLSKNTWSHQTVSFLPDGRVYEPSKPDMMLEPGFATLYRVGKKAAGRLLDGRTHDGFPA